MVAMSSTSGPAARRHADRERIGAEQRIGAAPHRHVVGVRDRRIDPDHALRGRHLGIEAGRARMVRSGARRPTTRRSRAPARSRSRPRAPSPDGPCRCRRRPARWQARCAFTVMFGRGLNPPAFSRRTYCGRRNTPCASAPVRSASPISSAHLAASSRGSPAAASASVISPRIAATGTFDWLIQHSQKSLCPFLAYRSAAL